MTAQIVNKRFRLTLDLDRSSDHVVGWSSHGGANQQVRPPITCLDPRRSDLASSTLQLTVDLRAQRRRLRDQECA